ncbi:hypothetical protein HHK36_002569 [Tetracentron sinense]|uniref:BRI1 kinase inhibitor 1-like n=1 Tax=Tetracentron sinense TaxID=13715 RepID=A0A834ZM96_TETSI|nr:hypothetical protein HHK36_002569 [Tetracentron sinense]
MNTQQHQKDREKVADKEGGEEKLGQISPTNTSSPPSASSSPSHEFSFTISLHSSSAVPDKTKSPPSFAIDLSPADDIFFHGHLLPLHLLSHLPISPRSSTNSSDSFNLPIKDLLEDQKPNNKHSSSNNDYHHNNSTETKARIKSKSFSLFGLTRWRKGGEVREREDEEKKKNRKRKLRFDVTHIFKKYVRMARPLLFFRGKRENRQILRQPYSYSGNLNGKQEWRGGRGGEFSAPASIWTSPTNSGLLVATATPPPSTSDSTMEELHTAIQAAIAHCKNSSTMEEKLRC